MSKAKTASEKASTATENNFKAGADALKAGFEKAAAGYDSALAYGQDNVQACVKSATVAGQNAENLNKEIYAFTKQSFEDSINATKAILGSKSVHEAFERQTDFAKAAFETYAEEATKFNALATAAAKDSLAPLQERFQAWAEIVQPRRNA